MLTSWAFSIDKFTQVLAFDYQPSALRQLGWLQGDKRGFTVNARSMICASAMALVEGLSVSAPAHAALTLIAVGGGGGGGGYGAAGAGGVISESGTSAGGVGGTGGLGGAGSDGGGGAGWLGGGGFGGGGGLALRPSPAAAVLRALATADSAVEAAAVLWAAAAAAAILAAAAATAAAGAAAAAAAPTSIPRCATRLRPRISTAWPDFLRATATSSSA
jgi:hypothetical protein